MEGGNFRDDILGSLGRELRTRVGVRGYLGATVTKYKGVLDQNRGEQFGNMV